MSVLKLDTVFGPVAPFLDGRLLLEFLTVTSIYQCPVRIPVPSVYFLICYIMYSLNVQYTIFPLQYFCLYKQVSACIYDSNARR